MKSIFELGTVASNLPEAKTNIDELCKKFKVEGNHRLHVVYLCHGLRGMATYQHSSVEWAVFNNFQATNFTKLLELGYQANDIQKELVDDLKK